MIGNHNAIRNEGYRILTQGLGVAGVIFLRQFENGVGNYTEERRSTLNENSVDEIAERIKNATQKGCNKPPASTGGMRSPHNISPKGTLPYGRRKTSYL